MATTWHMQVEKARNTMILSSPYQFSGTGQVNTCDSTYNTIAGCNNLDFTVNLNDDNNEAGQQ